MSEIPHPMSVPVEGVNASVEVPVRPSSVGSVLVTSPQSIKAEPQISEVPTSTPSGPPAAVAAAAPATAAAISPSNLPTDLKPLGPVLTTPQTLIASQTPPTSTTPKVGPSIDTEIRIVFTGVTTEARLAILQLLSQMPKTNNVAPYRLVENVNEATHVITERLTRTFKIYMAVALGCPIVTAKWVQACLIRGDWLGKS